MLRVIHAFDLKPGVVEESFINWLDSRLDEITSRFGCLERKTWVFIDGIRGDYEKEKRSGVPSTSTKRSGRTSSIRTSSASGSCRTRERSSGSAGLAP